MQVWRGFQEGNAYQYTFYVPHDPKGLIGKMGAEEFSARLDSIFTWSEPKPFSGGTPYVQRYVPNGKPVTDLRIPFSAITDGGKLEVEMGAEPVDDYSAQ